MPKVEEIVAKARSRNNNTLRLKMLTSLMARSQVTVKAMLRRRYMKRIRDSTYAEDHTASRIILSYKSLVPWYMNKRSMHKESLGTTHLGMIGLCGAVTKHSQPSENRN